MVFQSTHPSGVRPHVGVRLHGHLRISIHAPQWGATRATRNSRQSLLISIHAPQWGATDGDQLCLLAPWYFNPRTPVGCDDCLVDGCVADLSISIHAPQWGATPAISAKCAETQFQSTHPSGVRRQGVGVYHFAHTISIHAPQWGATQLECGQPVPIGISIHAPQWGATVSSIRVQRPHHISIHAPQWGATRVVAHISGHALFQSTHPSGVRRYAAAPRATPTDFNPRTPVGCDHREFPRAAT